MAGSGSTLSRILIELTTGFLTGSIYNDKSLSNPGKNNVYAFVGENRQESVIAVKTHGPWRNHNVLPTALHSVLLLRNPFDAIASYFNWEWTSNHFAMDAHSLQAPEQDWILWREKHWKGEFEEWIKHLLYWTTNSTGKTVVVFYENLVLDSVNGIQELQKMINILKPEIPLDKIKCVWEQTMASNLKGE